MNRACDGGCPDKVTVELGNTQELIYHGQSGSSRVIHSEPG